MRFDLDRIEALDASAAPVGMPLSLAIDSIDEDPEQPRVEFEPEALQQLADTIAERGVRQPISVRTHPDQPGRWLLNFGARRLRAARLAGKTEIPAFLDQTVDSYDQVIENEQRENLHPLELALFVRKQLDLGVSQADIARRLGKTSSYLTFVGAMIDPPDWLLELYRSGRCRGVTELYELRKLQQARPDDVARWLETQDKVSRADVQALKARLTEPACERRRPADTEQMRAPSIEPLLQTEIAARARSSPPSNPAIWHEQLESGRAFVLQARFDCNDVTIDLTAAPDEDGWVFVHAQGSDEHFPVRAADVQLVRIARLPVSDV